MPDPTHHLDHPKYSYYWGVGGLSSIGIGLMAPKLFWIGATISYVCAALILLRYWPNGKLVWSKARKKSDVIEAAAVFVLLALDIFIPSYYIYQKFLPSESQKSASEQEFIRFTCVDEQKLSSEDKVRVNSLRQAEDTRLGNPKGCVQVVPFASIGYTEKAGFIWIDKVFYFMLHVADSAWWSFAEFAVNCEIKCESNTLKLLIARYGRIPNGLHAHPLGLAGYLGQNPDVFTKIGWFSWLCQLDGGVLFMREFDNGKVYGVFPVSTSNNRGNICVLYNDRSWRSPYYGSNPTGAMCTAGSRY